MRWLAAIGLLALAAPAIATADDAPPPAVEEAEAPPPLQTLIEPADVDADLRVKQLPVQMKIRPKVVAQKAGPEPDVSTSKTATASNWRSIRERISFQIRAGLEVDTAADSGETLRGGARLTDDFAGTRPWIMGDAIVGARNIVLPSLGAYLLSSFQLDASDSLATRTATVMPSDADNLPIVIKAGYGEYGRDDVHKDKKFWLRAGRQFRLDGGAMFAYFDGATVGYREKAWDVSAFAGQRVSLYIDTEKGITYGATAGIDLAKGPKVPLKLQASFMGLAINDGLEDVNRMLAVLNATYTVSKKASVNVRARLVDSGGGMEIGRAGGRFKLANNSLIFIADVEQRFGGDLAYDLAAPGAVDVVQISQKLGVGLSAPIDATTFGGRIDWRNKKNTAEVLVFGRAEVPAETVLSVDQRGWFEGGLALAGAPLGMRGRGVWATAQYKYRQYNRDCDAGENSMNNCTLREMDDLGNVFGDSSTSGLDRMQELAVDATMYTGGRGRRWRFNLGVFYRAYDFRSPYVEVTDEGRAGGRGDLQVWISKDLRLDVAAEIAEPSAVLARELGTMSSVRAAVEARW